MICIYAAYFDDEFIVVGTACEVAKFLDIKRQSVIELSVPSKQKRGAENKLKPTIFKVGKGKIKNGNFEFNEEN
ncbi:MAG: hypothetical protein ACRC17_06335 [Culicoidibacterales bacterium]